jgi:hypothetical protein
LLRMNDLAVNAASHALLLDKPVLAIELLEAGRAVFWGQYLRLRSTHEQLPPDIGTRLSEISRLLESAAVGTARITLKDSQARAKADREVEARRRLGDEFEDLMGKARELPGMKGFMLNKTYDDLRIAARRGPVLVLLVHKFVAWAVITKGPGDNPIYMQLPGVTEGSLRSICAKFRFCIHGPQRGMKKSQHPNTANIADQDAIIQYLWHKIMQPVVNVLGWKVIDSMLRPSRC